MTGSGNAQLGLTFSGPWEGGWVTRFDGNVNRSAHEVDPVFAQSLRTSRDVRRALMILLISSHSCIISWLSVSVVYPSSLAS